MVKLNKKQKELVKSLNSKAVYYNTDKKEALKLWKKLSPEAKLELIALSRMTGEDITNNLNEEEAKLYNKLCYDWA